MRHTQNLCTKCGKPSVSGLIQGAGKCQYHWNEGVFGKEWADELLRREEEDREEEAARLKRALQSLDAVWKK